MFRLFSVHFTGVTERSFRNDLGEKEWAIVLRGEAQEIFGFTTLLRYPFSWRGETYGILYSGDTIIHREYWGSFELFRSWIRLTLALAGDGQAERNYWFLICSGYRTYRLLPTFFREFVPRPEASHRELAALLPAVAKTQFGPRYDEARGLVTPRYLTPLRRGIGEITARERGDPAIDFFVRKNPEHEVGVELACLAELSPQNLTRAGLRMAGFRSRVQNKGAR
jgi:hypothetical protein